MIENWRATGGIRIPVGWRLQVEVAPFATDHPHLGIMTGKPEVIHLDEKRRTRKGGGFTSVNADLPEKQAFPKPLPRTP